MIYKKYFFIFFLGSFVACRSPQARNEKSENLSTIEGSQDLVEEPKEANTPTDTPLHETKGSLKKDPPQIKKTKKEPKGRFNFSGDEFIKESGSNPFEKKNDTVMRIRGRAKVSTKNLRMVSPQIEIYGSDGRYAYAKGPVELVDTKNNTRITANEALFLRSENKAILRGDTRLQTRINKKKKDIKKELITLTANEMERRFDTATSLARGNVIVKTEDGVLYANEVEFFETQNLVRSSSSPRIFTTTDLILADAIEWNITEKKTEFYKNVKGFFNRQRSDIKRKDNDSVETTARADNATLFQDENSTFKQRLILRNRIIIERGEFKAFADEAEIFGAAADLIKAKNKIRIINHDEKSESFGDFFEWHKKSGYTSLSARPHFRTRTILYDDKGAETVEIQSATATRATTDSQPQARGDVRILQREKDKATTSTSANMGGEWAEINPDEKIIRLYGRPYIEGEMGRIAARNIILYYEERRYEMLGIEPGLVEKQMNRSEGEHE
ncbi:MAG TPA: hypothetical protein PLY93_07260 [Turneriella sp.]|nr:hypothetical protein [Turneriella sp.]